MRLATVAALLLAGFLALLGPAPAKAGMPPPADAVFQLEASRADNGDLKLDWTIIGGNYLYRDKIAVLDAGGNAIAVTTPAGEMKDDPNFGPTEVYHERASARIAAAALGAAGPLALTYQGCADEGICYPPTRKTIDPQTLAIRDTGSGFGLSSPKIDFAALDTGDTSTPAATPARIPAPEVAEPVAAPASASDAAPLPAAAGAGTGALLAGNPVVMLAAFLGFGLLLALTPCVFPMIPILTGIIARSGGTASARRGFALSLAYVLAMAAAYGLLGVVASWSGQNLQAALQTPLALGLMSLVLVALALSMFGLFDLQAPAALTRLIPAGTGGSLAGAAVLGFGSALIVGPCVTPPLAAALLYVSQTGDVARGAGALFALGLGMGLPLIAVGTFGAGILPRSGPWLGQVKALFGVVFLGLAIEMAGRVLPGPLTLALWALLAIGTGVALTASRGGSQRPLVDHPRRTIGFAALVYGVVLIIGASAGSDDPLRPLAFLSGTAAPTATPYQTATRVASPAAFDSALSAARAQGRPVLVSFTADWCTVCKSNERTVLRDPAISARLERASIVVADVTETNAETEALMRRFDVVGPPTLLLIDPDSGREIDGTRSIGTIATAAFEKTLRAAGI
ncbi:protein-disulfide reductase DsbD [Kaistia adipata]|uniref:protein-disulfide reductase DsbD n=1 Tax=Kaistia adipata TaxID=166954 RepID=UPI0004293439|nr:protein-disulfide reductase DsbD [Kaistia adipata]